MKDDDRSPGLEPLSIELFAAPREVTDDDLRGRSTLVIDVLRSSTTIACALTSGAREIIPVLTPAEGGELASRSGRGVSLLCGEREGRRIDGFDLGNSPFEFTPERVGGRVLIFSSTNGSAAILRARAADRIYIGGFNNFNAVMRRLVDERRSVVILCAGNLDQFAIEDFVCGGKFANALDTRLKRTVAFNDGARAAGLLHRHFDGSIIHLLKSSEHGRFLMSLGFEQDIEFCARVDTHPVVPMLVEGKIRGYQPDGSPLSESPVNSA
jgi:2-phosphosulfolactate phosphatase